MDEEEEGDAVIQINVNNESFTNGHAVMKTVSIDCMLSLYHIVHTAHIHEHSYNNTHSWSMVILPQPSPYILYTFAQHKLGANQLSDFTFTEIATHHFLSF